MSRCRSASARAGGARMPSGRAGVRDPVDDAVVVVADQERAVGEDREPGRPAEDFVSVVKEPGEEVVVPFGLARRGEAEPGDAVAVGRVPVPGAVQGHERVAAVLGRKRGPVVEPELDRRGMGREPEQGGFGTGRERLLRGAGRVGGRELVDDAVAVDVRPAVVAAVDDPVDLLGRQVVAAEVGPLVR